MKGIIQKTLEQVEAVTRDASEKQRLRAVLEHLLRENDSLLEDQKKALGAVYAFHTTTPWDIAHSENWLDLFKRNPSLGSILTEDIPEAYTRPSNEPWTVVDAIDNTKGFIEGGVFGVGAFSSHENARWAAMMFPSTDEEKSLFFFRWSDIVLLNGHHWRPACVHSDSGVVVRRPRPKLGQVIPGWVEAEYISLESKGGYSKGRQMTALDVLEVGTSLTSWAYYGYPHDVLPPAAMLPDSFDLRVRFDEASGWQDLFPVSRERVFQKGRALFHFTVKSNL